MTVSSTKLEGHTLFLFILALFIAVFVECLDFSIANVAIISIAADFGKSTQEGTWVITMYAIANAISLSLTNRLVTRFGSIKVLIWSIAFFTFFSLCCGLAVNYEALVLFRILQGGSGGALIILPQSMIEEFTPREKSAKLLTVILVGMITAPVLGPLIGGYISENYTWRWIFYINVLPGIFTVFLLIHVFKGIKQLRFKLPIDVVGFVLLACALFCLQIVLDRGNEHDWFQSTTIFSLFTVSFVSFVLFVLWNESSTDKFLATKYLLNKNFTLGVVFYSIVTLSMGVSLILIPLFVQSQLGYTPLEAGWVIMPFGILTIVGAPIVGRLMFKIDTRLLITIGIAILAYSNFITVNMTLQATEWDLIYPRLIGGLGLAFILVPGQRLILSQVHPDDLPEATSFFNFVRFYLGGAGLATAIFVTCWTRRSILHHSNLTEIMTPLNTNTREAYEYLSADVGLSDEAIAQFFDLLVTNQAYMMGFNDVFWLCGWLLVLAIPMVYLCDKDTTVSTSK